MAFHSSWKWYAVKCRSKMVVEEAPESPTSSYTETLYLVRAQSYDQACKIAERRARRVVLSYRNIHQQTISRHFDRVIDCYCIGKRPDVGTVLYTCAYDHPPGEEQESQMRQLTLF